MWYCNATLIIMQIMYLKVDIGELIELFSTVNVCHHDWVLFHTPNTNVHCVVYFMYTLAVQKKLCFHLSIDVLVSEQ